MEFIRYITLHFDRSTDGRWYRAYEDRDPDVRGEGDTLTEAVKAWRAARVARAVGIE